MQRIIEILCLGTPLSLRDDKIPPLLCIEVCGDCKVVKFTGFAMFDFSSVVDFSSFDDLRKTKGFLLESGSLQLSVCSSDDRFIFVAVITVPIRSLDDSGPSKQGVFQVTR